MKRTVFRDRVRVFALLGCLLMGLFAGTVEAYAANASCDTGLSQRLSDKLRAHAAFRNDALRQDVPPPPSIAQIANTPCVSKELQKVTNGFSNMASGAAGGIGGMLNGMAGPAAGIMNNFFRSGFQSINDAAAVIPQMLNFQTQASSVLGDLLGNLGLGSGFSDELCGMMIDMMVKFVQCQVPMELPSLGSISGSLNDLMPEGCAGNAMRDTLYAVDRSRVLENLGQPLASGQNGGLSAGTATFRTPSAR